MYKTENQDFCGRNYHASSYPRYRMEQPTTAQNVCIANWSTAISLDTDTYSKLVSSSQTRYCTIQLAKPIILFLLEKADK